MTIHKLPPHTLDEFKLLLAGRKRRSTIYISGHDQTTVYGVDIKGNNRQIPLVDVVEWNYPMGDASFGGDTLLQELTSLTTPATTPDRAPCLCGCGEYPRGKKSLYIQGHDARAKGQIMLHAKLTAQVEAGEELEWNQTTKLAELTGWLSGLGQIVTCVCCGVWITDPQMTPAGPMGSVCATGGCTHQAGDR